MEWQPIESAPRDGSILLVHDLDLGVCLGYWSDEYEGGWMAQDEVGEYCGDLTHWMQLPKPPEEFLQ